MQEQMKTQMREQECEHEELLKECLGFAMDGAWERFGALGRAIGAATDKDCDETAAKALLWLALTELAGKSADEPDDSAERFADYVRDNIADATLNGCAAYFGYSPGHVSKILKSRTGKSFSQNITEYRLDKAKSLLKDTDLSMEDISLQIGFANASGFYKQFTAAFGLTPGQYRKTVK